VAAHLLAALAWPGRASTPADQHAAVNTTRRAPTPPARRRAWERFLAEVVSNLSSTVRGVTPRHNATGGNSTRQSATTTSAPRVPPTSSSVIYQHYRHHHHHHHQQQHHEASAARHALSSPLNLKSPPAVVRLRRLEVLSHPNNNKTVIDRRLRPHLCCHLAR